MLLGSLDYGLPILQLKKIGKHFVCTMGETQGSTSLPGVKGSGVDTHNPATAFLSV